MIEYHYISTEKTKHKVVGYQLNLSMSAKHSLKAWKVDKYTSESQGIKYLYPIWERTKIIS